MSEDQHLMRILIKGDSFTEESALLSSSIAVLNGYEQSLSPCLAIAAQKYSKGKDRFPTPRIGLTETKTSSLDVKTVLDLATVAAPLAPHIPAMLQYGIDLYGSAGTLISLATKHFSMKKEPVKVNIVNSPGTTVLVASNGDISISDPNILAAAKQIHKPLDMMAQEVQSGNVDTIDVYSADDDENGKFSLNSNNKNAFKVESKTYVRDEFLELKCDIYSFNKKSGIGRLDLLEEEEKASYSFGLEGVEHYLGSSSLAAAYSVIKCNTEMQVNALGEQKIKKDIHS